MLLFYAPPSSVKFDMFLTKKVWHERSKQFLISCINDFTHRQWRRKFLQAGNTGKCINTDILWSVVYVWVYMLTSLCINGGVNSKKKLKIKEANFCPEEFKKNFLFLWKQSFWQNRKFFLFFKWQAIRKCLLFKIMLFFA